MANVEGTFYSATTQRRGVTPVSPPNAVDDPVTPLNPPGSNPVHDPLTLGIPANGLSLIGQELSIGLASSGVTGVLSGTDWDKFNSFSLSDGLVIIGGAVQTGNDITYDTVWQVRISDVLYSPLVSTLISFPVTSSGFTRIDLTVLDNSGVISRVAGTEVAVGSPVTAPSVPANSVALQEVTIIDTGISAVTNFALSSFVRFDINNQGLNGTQRSNARTNIGAIGGTIASGQVAFGTGAGTIGGGNVLTWNEGRLNIVSVRVPSLTTYRDADVLSVGTAAQFFEMGARKGSVFTSAIRVSGVLLSDGNNGHLAASVLSGGSLVEYLRLIANGNLLIGTPTDSGDKLRVNGTVRIDTISNLGTAATVLLTKSATGVISERTLAEVSTDMSSVLFTSQTLTASQKIQARVNIGSTSATPQVIATAGAINDLAITSNHLVFTGASVVLSGIVSGLDGEEITILNASGSNLELLSQSALSIEANRFASGVIVPNLSIVRLKYRTTTARWVLENVGINDGRYVRKDVSDTFVGVLSGSGNPSGIRVISSSKNDTETSSIVEFGVSNVRTISIGRYINGPNLGASALRIHEPTISQGSLFFIPKLAAGLSLTASINKDTGRIFHARSGASNESVRRDELYLNYSQTVATTGTINDLAINADCKLLILTGADDLTGVVPVDNTRLLRIEARGASRIIRHESASSTAANRFSIGSDLTINAGEVYQFIYTDSRWRRIL